MAYGEQLARGMKVRKMTNFKVAAEAGLSPTTVTRLKKSSRNVTISTLDQAADAVGMRVEIKLVPKPGGERRAETS